MKDHEVYRRCAALRDPLSLDDVGSQGTLKYSITVLGPKDTQKLHDPTNEEEEAEKDQEITEGSGSLDQNGVPNQTLQYLVLSLWKAEGLPGFDRFISTIKRGLFTYVKFEFAGVEISTVKQAVSGAANLSVNFQQELWIPVYVPSMCKRAAISIMNKEFGRKDQLLATAYVNFDDIERCERDPIARAFLGLGSKNYSGPSFKWIHFYGANPLVRGGPKDAQLMNKFPSLGSSYRGSVLAALRVVKFPDGSSDEARVVEMDYSVPDNLQPQGAMYTFRVMIYQGSDFGSQGAHASSSKGPKYALGVRVGPHEVRSQFKHYEDGAVDWGQLMSVDMVLPVEYQLLPDTIITVYKGSESASTSVAYHRFHTADILPKADAEPPSAKWYVLKHDLSHRSVSTIGFPGSALLAMSLVNKEDVVQDDDGNELVNWEPERRRMEIRQAYCMRVSIYQCRNLPAVNDVSVIDPYVKVRFAGQKQKTSVKPSTQNPAFFEILDFKAVVPTDLKLCPHVLVQVWDQKRFNNTPIAAIHLSLSELHASFDLQVIENVNSTSMGVPHWHTLKGIDGQKELGEVLIGFQLFKLKDVTKSLAIPRSIVPPLKRAFLDIILVGLRDLMKMGRTAIRKPYITVDVVGYGYGTLARSCNMKNSNPSNPNFQDRLVLQVDLPEDPMFTPSLEIRVLDERRVGGKVLIGYAVVPLFNKIEWNSDDYEKPRSHEVMLSTIKERQAQEELKKKLIAKDAKRVKAKAKHGEDDMTSSKDGPTDGSIEVVDTKNGDKVDSGVGVFPTTEDEDDPDTRLPNIFDEEEVEARKVKQAKQESRLADNDHLGLSIGADFSEINDDTIAKMSSKELRKLIHVPDNWISSDFMKDREHWIRSKEPGAGGELERFLKTYPFENYEIFRGHIAYNKFGKRRNTLRRVGVLKGVIRCCLKNPRYDIEYDTFFKTLRQNVPIVVRVYIIKAQNLQHPEGIFSGPPDPYLKVSFGGREIKDSKKVMKKTTSPEFYSFFEFTEEKKTIMPGTSLLKIALMDKNHIFPDESLGETVVDLEDRWFHPVWNRMPFNKRYLEVCIIYVHSYWFHR
jgi:hypothetical protein